MQIWQTRLLILVVYGPEQVGKTTLIQSFLKRIKSSFSGYDLIVIDEVQKIQGVGTGLKMLVDHLPDVKVLASGSSSFELSNKVGEPLAGRQKVIKLFPFAALELKEIFGPIKTLEMLP